MRQAFSGYSGRCQIVVTNPIPPLVRPARVEVSASQSETGIALSQAGRQPADGEGESCLRRGCSNSEPDTVLISQTLGDARGPPLIARAANAGGSTGVHDD